MITWPTNRIGDIAEVKGGKRLPAGKLVQDEPTPYRYIRVTDFTPDGLDRAKVKYLDEESQFKITRYIITDRDVYISIAGTIGLVGIVPPDFSGANLTENAAKICEIQSKVEPQFLMYYLRTKHGQAQVASLTVGTSQPKLALFRIKDIEVPCPALPVQRRIADILSAYEEFMENSQRRIWILEAMARALYREWFVHFRFPGHEKHPRVASPLGDIPQGWEVKKLGEVLEFNYGKALKQEDRSGGDVPVFGSSGIVGQHDTALVKGPGIIVGRKGNVGSVFWCVEDFFVIDTAYFVTSSLPLRFLFYVLPTLNFLNSDAAVPGLSRNQAYTLEVLLPPVALLKKFCDLADTFERQASTLQRQIQNLRRTRDLLLPRLLSGQVALEA